MLCRNGAQKLLGVLITIGEAVAYVVSGMYGDVRELGAGNAVLIILQVCPHCISATIQCYNLLLPALTSSQWLLPHIDQAYQRGAGGPWPLQISKLWPTATYSWKTHSVTFELVLCLGQPMLPGRRLCR